MNFKLEQNIPVPAALGAPRYPFRHLKVGDSVLYECAAPDKLKACKAAYRLAEHHGWQIIARKLAEGVRVWRVQ